MRRILVFVLALMLMLGLSSCLSLMEQFGDTLVEKTTADGYAYVVQEDDTVRITGYTSLRDEVIIPSELDGHKVTRIGDGAFFGRDDIVSVTIPDGVTDIGSEAFALCESLEEVTIPESVTAIGDSAFMDCESLEEVTIPESVERIGEAAFCACGSLNDVRVSPGNAAFMIADGVLFGKTDRRLVWCPCMLAGTYTIPAGTEKIGRSAFSCCTNLEEVTIPDSVTEIGDQAFSFCTNLESVAIGQGVTRIGSEAFRDCGSLEEVTIPDGVTEIYGDSFEGCVSLTDLRVSPNHPCFETVDGVLFRRQDKCLVRCPGGLTGACEIPEGTREIGQSAFTGCDGLTEVTIPDSVTKIRAYAFASCPGLAEVTIPAGVTMIGYGAFMDCDGLTLIVTRGSVAETSCREQGWVYRYTDGSCPEAAS